MQSVPCPHVRNIKVVHMDHEDLQALIMIAKRINKK